MITKIKIDATLKRLEREVQEIADIVVPPLTPSQPYPQSTRLVAHRLTLHSAHANPGSPFRCLGLSSTSHISSQGHYQSCWLLPLSPSRPNGQSSPECQTRPVSRCTSTALVRHRVVLQKPRRQNLLLLFFLRGERGLIVDQTLSYVS